MIGTLEAATRLAEAGRESFRPPDLQATFELDRRHAAELAGRLARANFARRVTRGFYVLLPPREWRNLEGLPANWYAVGAALAAPDPYYLAYGTAMELHDMTVQPLRSIFIAVTRQRRAVHKPPVRFRFVTVRPHRFFGFEEREVEPGTIVNVADLERTFIDAVDRPDLAGGLEDVLRGLRRRRDALNRDRLLRYLLELDQPVLNKRLGYLLELAGYDDPRLVRELERVTPRLKWYVPLDKATPPARAHDRRWEIDVNVDVDRLIKATET